MNFTLNKGKAHFKFGHDRTDVTDSESNLITSAGDIAKETITEAVLTVHMDKPQQGNNSTALCWCFSGSKTMDCIPTRKVHKVKKTWSYSTRTFAWTDQRTHTVHAFTFPIPTCHIPMERHPGDTAVLSPGHGALPARQQLQGNEGAVREQ